MVYCGTNSNNNEFTNLCVNKSAGEIFYPALLKMTNKSVYLLS